MGLHSTNKKSGFTLVETLVYATILVLLFGVVVDGLLQMSRTYKVLKVHRLINLSSISGLERMTYEIKQADDIDPVRSVFNATPGKLVLIKTLADLSTTSVEFYLVNSILMMKQGSVVLGALTQASSTVDSLIFRPITNNNTSKAVRVEMQISAITSGYSKTAKLYTTAILRGSY